MQRWCSRISVARQWVGSSLTHWLKPAKTKPKSCQYIQRCWSQKWHEMKESWACVDDKGSFNVILYTRLLSSSSSRRCRRLLIRWTHPKWNDLIKVSGPLVIQCDAVLFHCVLFNPWLVSSSQLLIANVMSRCRAQCVEVNLWWAIVMKFVFSFFRPVILSWSDGLWDCWCTEWSDQLKFIMIIAVVTQIRVGN